MNGRDTPNLISTRVPSRCQENASFIIDLDALDSREDVYCDDNGVWLSTGGKSKLFTIERGPGNKVLNLTKVTHCEDPGSADVTVCRRTYRCKSCPTYHRTIVSVVYGKEIQQWFPLVLLTYYYDGRQMKFEVQSHGHRKKNKLAHVRTKKSTKDLMTENLKQQGTKRALFQTVQQAGGVCGAESQGSLPRNVRQAIHLKYKESRKVPSASKDPLASVLELQKSTFPGFIRDVTCNDLPTVTLFTDRQMDNLIKFCCHSRPGWVSELGVDVTFQLGPFYLLVTTFRNTLLEAKRSSNAPAFPGPMMICMTKEECTYLSFVHRLLREVPGLSSYLHATGTDDETGLRNALAAGFHGAHPLLCYIHSERNVKEKARQLGLSQHVTSRICKDVYVKSGLIWSDSYEEFNTRLQSVREEWDAMETSERVGSPKFSEYFDRNKVEDIQNCTAKYVMKGLGLGEEPYHQNVPESMNEMMKSWTSFVPQEMDSFIISLFDFVESFDYEEEMAWFGMSEKWQVKDDYRRYMPTIQYSGMSPDERTKEMKRIRNLRPDSKTYKACRDFKFTANSKQSTSGNTSHLSSIATTVNDEPTLSSLLPHFSKEEASSMVEKAKVIIHNNAIRRGFQSGTFLVDSGSQLPHRVSCLKSGKVSCPCTHYTRNNMCQHSMAVAIHTNCFDKMVSQYSGRNLTRVATSTTRTNVGSKAPPSRKHKASVDTPPSQIRNVEHDEQQLTSEAVNDTTIVIRKAPKPSVPPPTAPLVLKEITGGIRKCAGCCKPLATSIPGYNAEQDQTLCFGRFEAYSFWNKADGSYKVATSTRHYHLNPVCTKVQDAVVKIDLGSVVPDVHLRALIAERFNYHLP